MVAMDAGFKRTALVASRARLAPIKMLTVPRLELCGAVMAEDLVRDVKEALDLADNVTVATWTDSKTVLSWLKSTDLALRMFVANRVQKITMIVVPNCWRYVPTDTNPADLLSRGASPGHLSTESLWQCGPTFLRGGRTPQQPQLEVAEGAELQGHRQAKPQSKWIGTPQPQSWPTITVWGPLEEQWKPALASPENMASFQALADAEGDGVHEPQGPVSEMLQGSSSWLRAVRVIARMGAWKLAAGVNKRLTLELLQWATTAVFRIIQVESFPGTLDTLRRLGRSQTLTHWQG